MLYLNQGGQGFAPAWSAPVEMRQNRLYFTIGDYLGEGKQSVLVFLYPDFGSTPVLAPYMYIHCENGVCSCDVLSNLSFMVANDLVPGDFDGDGHTEILVVNTTDAATFHMCQNNGGFFFEQEHYCSEIDYVPELNLFPGDYNGDGKDDLLCYGQKSGTTDLEWFFLISSGTDFRSKVTHVFEGLNLAPQDKMYTYSLERVSNTSGFAMYASDFDGDGFCDIALAINHPNNTSLRV